MHLHACRITIKTSDSSLEKYTSHFIERVVCERKLETEQNCNILPPLLWSQQRFFPVLLGCSTGGPGAWGPASLGAGFLYCILSPTGLISNCNCSIGGLRAHSAGCWFSLPHFSPTANASSCALSYIIVQRPPSSCGRHKSHSFNPSTVKVIFWYSSTGCTCYLHWCISYFDRSTGSKVNIQHIYHLIVWSNLNFLQLSLWITLLTQ